MKKLHGMRKASGMTKDIPTGFYVQISLDLSDYEIVAARLGSAENLLNATATDWVTTDDD